MYIKPKFKKKFWAYLEGLKKKICRHKQDAIYQSKFVAFTKKLKTDAKQLLVNRKMNPKVT